MTPPALPIVTAEDVMGKVNQVLGRASTLAITLAALRMAKGAEDHIVVSPAGSGKSAIFLAWALSFPDKTIVVILPLKALLSSLLQRARDLGIDAEQWSLSHRGRHPTLLLVQAEDANRVEFQQDLRSLEALEHLHLIVIDEVQEFLLAGDDFRPQLPATLLLHTQKTATFFLSGSLSLTAQEDLIRTARLTDPKILRDPTVRPNISYEVERTGGESEAIRRLGVLLRGRDRVGGERTIVFFMAKKLLQDVQQKLDIRTTTTTTTTTYYHGLPDDTAKTNLQDWWEGTKPIMLATTSLSVGISHQDLNLTVHFGSSYSLESFYQGSSRGGRKGQPSKAIVLTYPGALNPGAPFHSFVHAKTCRRQLLHRHLDGPDAATCLDQDSDLCDLCRDALTHQPLPMSSTSSSSASSSSSSSSSSSASSSVHRPTTAQFRPPAAASPTTALPRTPAPPTTTAQTVRAALF
jgi:superfamily II DNA helicase RecQ